MQNRLTPAPARHILPERMTRRGPTLASRTQKRHRPTGRRPAEMQTVLAYSAISAAFKYSRFISAIAEIEICFGHTASHSP